MCGWITRWGRARRVSFRVLKKKKKVTLSIIPEARWLTEGPAGAKVENCVCVTYPRASPQQPLSNCRFTRGEWSWHDKLRQNNSVGWRSANLWDWDRGMCDARESSHVMNTISATCRSRIWLPAACWRRGRQLFVLFKMKMKQCNVMTSARKDRKKDSGGLSFGRKCGGKW